MYGMVGPGGGFVGPGGGLVWGGELLITTEVLPAGREGDAYTVPLSAAGGTPPYTWAATGLPAGLTLDPSAGVISGTPTSWGTFLVHITATDDNDVTASADFDLLIVPMLQIVTPFLAHARVGHAYSQTINAIGGIPPYTWTLIAGTIPPGLTFVGNLISGTPSATGTSSLTFEVEDDDGVTAERTYTLQVFVDDLRVFAEVDLNDRAHYYGGYKYPRVLDWHGVLRGCSDREGQIQQLSYGMIVSDIDYFFRGALADPERKYLTNRPGVMRMIDDESRRIEGEPMMVANGFVTEYGPLDDLRFEVRFADWLKRKFARRSRVNESWQRRIMLADFPFANGQIDMGDGETREYTSAGQIVPLIYGRITDTFLPNQSDPFSDHGDGQFVPIYVGDYVLSGDTWRGALVAAHHCAYIEAGFVLHNPVDLATDPDWLTPRNAAAWAAAGFTSPWMNINGRDYCMIFLKGYAGDLFVGKEPIPPIAQGRFGNVPIAINVWGRTTTGDDSGALIENGFDIYLDFLRNYVAPDVPWQMGGPLAIPEFPTVPLPLIDVQSFEIAKAIAEARLTGGYPLNFAIGANNQSDSMLNILAAFNVNLDCESYFTREGQYAVTMEPPDTSGAKAPLTDVLDITQGSFKVVDQVDQNFWNVLPFRHTYDYAGRMQAQYQTDWRSEMTGDLERRHLVSINNYDQERPAPTYEFRMIRGKNRASDSNFYVQGTLAVNDIMQRLLARYANPRRVITLAGPYNLLHYECGDVFPISTIEGIGPAGWAGRHLRILTFEVLASEGRVIFDCYDFDAVLETAAGI